MIQWLLNVGGWFWSNTFCWTRVFRSKSDRSGQHSAWEDFDHVVSTCMAHETSRSSEPSPCFEVWKRRLTIQQNPGLRVLGSWISHPQHARFKLLFSILESWSLRWTCQRPWTWIVRRMQMARSQLSSLLVLSGQAWGFTLTQSVGETALDTAGHLDHVGLREAEPRKVLHPTWRTSISNESPRPWRNFKKRFLQGDLGQGDDREGDGRDSRGNVAGGVGNRWKKATSIAPKPQQTLKIMVREAGTGGYSKEIFEVLTNQEEEECLMQVVSAAAGPVRCDGSTGYQTEDECASSTSSHMCRRLRQPLTDRLWQGPCGLGLVLWNPQQPFEVLWEVVFETNESTSPATALTSIANITFTFICAEASNDLGEPHMQILRKGLTWTTIIVEIF